MIFLMAEKLKAFTPNPVDLKTLHIREKAFGNIS